MATPLLDFAALTAPLEGDHPAGVRLPLETRRKMEDARKDFEPNPDDPSAPPIPKAPDWSGVIRSATESLSSTSKDLLAAVRLVEALSRRDGFAGLRDGLHLLKLLCTECWDRVHPLIEEPDDMEYRAGPIQWLCEPEGGAWFPPALAKFPLLRIGGAEASYTDCKNLVLDGQTLSVEALAAAEPAMPTLPEEVTAALSDLDELDKVLTEKMADQAPSLGGLRDVVAGCKRYLDNLRGPTGEGQAGADGEVAATGGQVETQKRAGGSSRADMYRQLARLADDLARMEPHSPIPDLLRWAVKLGAMPFRELIQELVREPGVLADVRRQFGIAEPEAQQQQ